MNDSRSVRELFDELVDLDGEARLRYLSSLELRGPDSERLAALLAGDSAASTLLPASVDHLFERIGRDSDPASQLIGTQAGSFTLLEVIGEGGSSVVFRAQRPIGDATQVVALKLMYASAFSAGQQRRSQREQAILAQLSHPNIAHLVEAGSTAWGVPYIAMEYVAGSPVTHAANARALGLRERIGIMISLCGAIDAAHGMLAVHCDLKPSNVFMDAQGRIKVLDFGVARLLELGPPRVMDRRPGSESTRTIALTPEYAAPEQFLPGPTTVAVDVFALGVILGELLTGQRLRESTGIASRKLLEETACDIPDGLPPRAALARLLRGDLDRILAMATAADPAQRYRSANALAADLQRYLDGQPVVARNGTGGYKLWKLVRRHRLASAGIVAFVVTITASALFAYRQAEVARRSEERALAQGKRADAMRDSVFEVFLEAEPTTPGKSDVTIVEAADKAIDRLLSDTATEPRSRLELLERFAQTVGLHGRADRARDVLQTAFDQSNSLLGPSDEVTLSIGIRLAKYLNDTARHLEARALVDRMLPLIDGAPRELEVRLLRRSALAAWRVNDYPRALADGRAAVELSRASGDDDLERMTLSDFAVVLLGIGNLEEAIRIFEDLLVLNERTLGPEHEKVAMTYAALSRAYRRVFDIERAEVHARKALEITRAIYKVDHPVVVNHLNALAVTLFQARKFEEALATDLEALRMGAKVLGAGHPDHRITHGSIGADLIQLERYEEALPYLEKALHFKVDRTTANETAAAFYRASYGYALAMAGETARGRSEIEASLDAFERLSPPAPEKHTLALARLVSLALRDHDLDAADRAIRRIEELVPTLPAADTAWWHGRAELLRGSVSLARNHPAQALDFLQRAEAAVARRPNPDRCLPAELKLLRAQAQLASGLPDAARASWREGKGALSTLRNPPSRLTLLNEKLERELGEDTGAMQ